MNSLVTENHGEIISYYDYQNKVLISTICILEVYFSKITNKHLIHLNCRRKEDVTLAQLSLIYESYFHKNSGMKGICWEYYIFNSIKNKNFYIQGLINEAINLLSFENTFDNIDAILWAGERTDLSVDYIKTLLSNENTIWSLNNQYNFKNHIDCVYNSFHLKKHRQNLPNNISGIWKTDLFVKKENSSTWYATTVKWNTNQMKCYNGLSIGISFDPAEKLYNRYYLDIQKNNSGKNSFIHCKIPFTFDFGSLYNSAFHLMSDILLNLNCSDPCKKTSTFRDAIHFSAFLKYYEIKENTCMNILNYLKGLYCYNINTKKQEILIETNNKSIIETNNTYISDNTNSNIILLPK